MAILHSATLSPSKLELITTHLQSVPWLSALPDEVRLVGAYRFDDPAGQVGIETHLVSVGAGPTIQVPLTYRDAPLPTAAGWLIATMDHSALGTRWVYDGCGDPVFATALIQAIIGGGTEAKLLLQTESGTTQRDPTVTVRGTGTSPVTIAPSAEVVVEQRGSNTLIEAGDHQVVVPHVLGDAEGGHRSTLLGSWTDSHTGAIHTDVQLAFVV